MAAENSEVRAIAELREVIARGPDPNGTSARLDRFLELGGALPRDAEALRLLSAVLASGTFLPELLFADVSGLDVLAADPWLRQPKPATEILADARAIVTGASGFVDFERRLRIVRRREMLRLGAREIGWGSTEEVARELSSFADVCLELAVAYCDAELRREMGTPVSDEGTPSFVVLAMGKLGGEELNFSSDIDLCYFYSTDAGEVGQRSLHEYYAELAHRVTRAIEEATGDGRVFRVDLRLRPEGRSGPICNSLAAAERYYETFGRTWERQALARARPCAGDLALGKELLETLDSFVFPRSIDERAIGELRALRALYRPKRGQTLGEGFDVKLGAGGIRDVELVVQTLQLLHGGKRRELRERSTIRGLQRLRVAGFVSDREARALAEAYRFWRRVEHRIQLEHGMQTHAVPADEEARTWLALRLGYSGAAELEALMARHREQVEAIAATFDDAAPETGPEALELLDPARSREESERALAALGFADPENAADSLDLVRAKIPPAFLEQAIASPDPDLALTHFRDLTLRGSVGLMALVREHPRLLRMLGLLFGTSERLSRLLLTHPEMWQHFLDSLGAPSRPREELRRALARRIADEADEADAEETVLRQTRLFQAEELLRIGLHEVAESLDCVAVSAQLTELAEVCLERTIEAVLPALEARYGQPRAGLTVLALGSFGAREMRWGSDLDLVFLYGDDGESTTGVDHREWYARASQRLIGGLEALLEEGRLYNVDMRLRPSGQQGMLVTTYRGFERYHRHEAAVWERIALLRARVVWTSDGDAGALARILTTIVYESPFDEGRFRADLLRMRERVEKERGKVPPGSRHLRFDPGGLMDVEFLTALGQLRASDDPALRTTETVVALRRLIERGWPPGLLDDYLFLRRVGLRLRMLRERPGEVLHPADLRPLARTLDLGDAASLGAELQRRMSRVRQTFEELF